MTTNCFFTSFFVAVFGSGIRDPGSEIRDPGSGMGKNQDPGSGINIFVRSFLEVVKLLEYSRISSYRNKDII